MRALPLSIGTIHFVGIGGIGMSGIAEVLKNLGYAVRGSDIAESANVKRLRGLGIPVEIGHRAENLADAAVVVISSAVGKDNPEVRAARAALIPVVRRAEMLGELMRLKWSVAIGGTHGKTTTTSLVGTMLEHAGFDPTVINGGIINAYGTNARLGSGDWMVVEADESDGTFIKLPACIAVVTNIDPEHLDFYGTFDGVRAAFDHFVQNIPFYGFAALCIDHAEVQAMIPRVSDRRIVTYGFSPQADVRAVNVETSTSGARFDVVLGDRVAGETRVVEGFELPMFGLHNVQNALAAVAVGNEMGIPDAALRGALARFSGVKRRFTKTGKATASPSSTTTATIRSRSRPSSGRRAPPGPGARSRSSSRIATRACRACSRSSAPASTTPTPSSSPTSTPPARRRSRGWTATRWSRACACAGTSR